MKRTDDDRLQESVRVNQDLHKLLLEWHERQADPLVVCTLMIIQFVSLAGHLFPEEDEYDRFVEAAVKRGKARFNESDEVSYLIN